MRPRNPAGATCFGSSTQILATLPILLCTWIPILLTTLLSFTSIFHSCIHISIRISIRILSYTFWVENLGEFDVWIRIAIDLNRGLEDFGKFSAVIPQLYQIDSKLLRQSVDMPLQASNLFAVVGLHRAVICGGIEVVMKVKVEMMFNIFFISI